MRKIGIDAGVNTGFAQWNTDKNEFDGILTLTFWEAITKLEQIQELEQFIPEDRKMHVYLEDPNVNKPTFFHKATASRVREKISQNVGSNKRDAQLIAEFCRYRSIKITLVPPNRKGKMKPEAFKQISNYKGKTSQHGRDAALLVLGR